MTVSAPSVSSQSVSRPPKSPRSIDSSRTSPSVQSTVASVKNSQVLSSLKDNYIYVVAQVTRDLHPVSFGEWLLPECGFDIGVADVTLDQFETLANHLGRNMHTVDHLTNWRHAISGSMISLARLMKVGLFIIISNMSSLINFVLKILPINYGICFELAYPSSKIRQTRPLKHQLDLNCFVDAVLRTIYHTSAALGGSASSRRRIIFTSFCPDVCSALNWKQPNCEPRSASLIHNV